MQHFVKKVAIVSHILPPSPSGQAVVLYLLLRDLSPDSYYLLSQEQRHSDQPGTIKLPGKNEYILSSVWQIPYIRRFMSKYLFFFLNAVTLILIRATQIFRALRKNGCNSVIACTGDLYDIPAAFLASRWARIPFVPYLFDDYLYQWTGPARRFAELIADKIFTNCTGAIAPNEYLANEYQSRYGLQCTIIRNPYETVVSEGAVSDSLLVDDEAVNIVYTGSVYHAHYDAFRNLLAAAKTIKSNIKLHIFTSQPLELLAANGICGTEVIYHSHVRQGLIPDILKHADILFLPLAFQTTIPEVIRSSSPGKMGEYLASGRPILVHAPADSFVCEYFRRNGCGMVVDNDSALILADALKNLISDKLLQHKMGECAIRCANEDFSLNVVRTKFHGFLSGL